MKKEYIKPTISIDTIDVELPISVSMNINTSSYENEEDYINGESDFLTKDRNDWSGLLW